MIYDIADIAFDQIHNEYYWGKYGDFKVIININTRYINATHLCGLAINKNGSRKEIKHWRSNISAEELITEISSSVGIPTGDLFNVIVGGQVTEIRGTYVHPDLIPHIASWASPKFAVKISKIVNAHMVREYKESIRAKDMQIDELSRKIEKVLKQNDELLSEARAAREAQDNLSEEVKQLTTGFEELSMDHNKLMEDNSKLVENNTKLVENVDILQKTTVSIAQKLDVATDDRVPRHPVDECNEMFAIYQKPGTSLYKMLRRQKKSFNEGVKNECRAHGYIACIFQSNSPNAVNLSGQIRDKLPKSILGRVAGNLITLFPGKTTDDLINFARATETEKKNV